jgi:hypothetical protein
MLITKEKVKQEIDKLPDNLVEKVYWFIYSIQPPKPVRKKIHSFKLKGQFDNINIRAKAYE